MVRFRTSRSFRLSSLRSSMSIRGQTGLGVTPPGATSYFAILEPPRCVLGWRNRRRARVKKSSFSSVRQPSRCQFLQFSRDTGPSAFLRWVQFSSISTVHELFRPFVPLRSPGGMSPPVSFIYCTLQFKINVGFFT